MASDGISSLLYFLAFGLFFYWMMRKGGCGMHGHGAHGHPGHGRTPSEDGAQRAALVRDPVCGMTVDPEGAVGKRTTSGGTTLYFCSTKCLDDFDRDPTAFAAD